MKDIIYKDKNFTICKEGADDLGTFIPMDCIEIIDIVTEQLGEWKNGGLAHISDCQSLIDELCKKLQETVSKK